MFTATQVVYPLSTFDIHKWKKVISTQANFTLLSVFFGAVRSEKNPRKTSAYAHEIPKEIGKKKCDRLCEWVFDIQDRLVFNAESSTLRRANTLGVSLSHEA